LSCAEWDRGGGNKRKALIERGLSVQGSPLTKAAVRELGLSGIVATGSIRRYAMNQMLACLLQGDCL
jgi:hypothetical protein